MTPTERVIPFVKASACGNDFLIVDGGFASADIADLSQRMCDRHYGVGADGVEWLFPSRDVDIRARLLNADGSEAEISGNGTRCVAAYLCSQEGSQARPEPAKDRFTILTDAGIKLCALISVSRSEYEFETAMGEPQVGKEFSLPLSGGEVTGVPVSMGNPHFVRFVQEYEPGWQAAAAEIGRSGAFPGGINVELVVVEDNNNVEARFFERGVGETQSSGTGSCACAVAAIATGRGVSPVRVHAPGGVQTVRWDEQVFLRGPARLICRGEFLV